ncbi:MAG: ABC-2 family transporter protein, partial [Coprococcus sp.]
MRKNIRVIRELIRLRLQNIMMFRLGFFGPFFVDGSLFLIQLLVFDAVYGNVEQIGGWGKGEMILYIGTFSLINAVNMVVWFFGIVNIPNKIKSGEMDLYLTKPVSPLLRLSLENINPGSIPLVIMSLFIIGYGINIAEINLNIKMAAGYILWVILMLILFYDLEVLIRSISFYVISTAKVEQLEGSCIE